MRAVRRILLLACLVPIGACNQGTSADDPQAQGNAAGDPALAAQPVKEQHRSMELTPQWLTGRWQTGEGNCAAGDTFFTIGPDGRYAFMQEQGRWSLQGSALTIEVTEASDDSGTTPGSRHTTQVRPISPNEAEFRTEGSDPIRVFRCHEG